MIAALVGIAAGWVVIAGFAWSICAINPPDGPTSCAWCGRLHDPDYACPAYLDDQPGYDSVYIDEGGES